MSLPAFQREFASKQRKRPAGAINCKSPSRTANWLRTRYPHHRRRNCQYQEVPLRSLQSLRLEPCALDSGSNQWERLSNRIETYRPRKQVLMLIRRCGKNSLNPLANPE